MKRTQLRRYFLSLDNGAWGDDATGDGSDVPCVRAADFDFVRLRAKLDSAPLRHLESARRRRLGLTRGDIVLEKSGGGEKQVVGRAVLFDHDADAVCSNFAARIRPRPDVDPRYLTYLLAALYYDGATAKCVLQTTGIQNLDTDAWLQTDVPVVAVALQRRIADFLDDQVARIDQATTARRMQADVLAEERRSGVHFSVTGGETATRQPSKLAWADTIPEHWGSVRVCQVARIGTGHTPSRSKPEYWVDARIPWLTTTDVYRFRFDQVDSINDTEVHISELGLQNSAAVIHPAGTVGLSRTSASAGFAIHMAVPMATSQDFATWTPGPRLNDMYLLWCLRSMHQDLMGRLAMGSTHKTIYFPELMSIRIPLPPLTEQESIVSSVKHFTDASRRHRTALLQSVDLLIEFKRSLITAAVMGEFDVSSADGSQVPV